MRSSDSVGISKRHILTNRALALEDNLLTGGASRKMAAVVKAEMKTPVTLVMRMQVCLGRSPNSVSRFLPYLRPITSPL